MSGEPGRDRGNEDHELSHRVVVTGDVVIGTYSRRRAMDVARQVAPKHQVVRVIKLRDGKPPLTVGTWFKGERVRR